MNTSLASQVWNRYTWLRDNGHLDYVKKAAKCEDFFAGLQWDQNDLALLKAQRRPAITINKIISTIANVMGEQIFNRTDIAFKPRNEGATAEVAHALTKVFMQIADNNQLPWVRSDVFADGIVTSRGFFDVRLDFTDSLRGEVRIEQLNPKNVLIDADADEYDPDKWNDVIISKWMSPDQIELLYGKKDAELLRSRTDSYHPYGYDSIDINRDRFGSARAVGWPLNTVTMEEYNNVRNIRVIERQWKKLDKVLHFVDLETGDTRVVPTDWDDDRIAQHLQANPNLATTKKLIQRIRWTVIADNVVLHDDWSPYKHFTVVPYFPYFRRGRTVGLVENLLGPQELLNKVSSQELHVVNTTANSGWKVKRNALQNMSTAELEQRGAQTGLVLELDEIANAEKIQPNQTPSGLDRISYKAEEHIKTISGVSDYMQGFAREDVAAKSVTANKQSGQANLAKVMDNMNRTDFLLARAVLDLVQEYYTEQRLIYITTDRLLNTTEQMTVNEPTPEGTIANDLTLGEYAVVVTNQPERDTFEETQFDQLVRLRTEVGVQVPDKFILQASRAKDKADIISEMESAGQSPEAQQQAALQMRALEADVAAKEAEATQKGSDAQLKQAKAQKELASIGEDSGQNEILMEQQKLEAEMAMEQQKLDQEFQLKQEQMNREFELKREQLQMEMALKREQATADAAIKATVAKEQAKTARVAAVHNSQPQPAGAPAGGTPSPKPEPPKGN
ncbi:MAG: genomic island protein [Gammaproteobacteria bacterium]|nr:genomic island protein [Gammaproteobacteria bacterium]